jgi:hypothetical protein
MWISVFVVLGVGGVAVGWVEEWSWAQSFYFVMITSTSVGYGDVSPAKAAGRSMCLVFCPFAVAIMSASIAQTVNQVFERHAAYETEILFGDSFVLDDLIHINVKGNNKVTEAKFLSFMLELMKKVEPSLLKRLKNQFDAVDADKSGFLIRMTWISSRGGGRSEGLLLRTSMSMPTLTRGSNLFPKKHSKSPRMGTPIVSSLSTNEGGFFIG